MTVTSDTAGEPLADTAARAPAVLAATQPFLWSVRREVWENRSLYICPAIVAVLVMFGAVIGAGHAPRELAAMAPGAATTMAFDFAAAALMFTGFLVAAFYCLGALYDERRDRSILFWKSLPVSDLTTVLAKASVPMVVLPVILAVVIMATQLFMLLLSTVVWMSSGQDPGALWARFLETPVALVYVLAAAALWLAPIYAWLLLVSGWARRAPLLWAVLPPLALVIVEKIGFQTNYVSQMIGYRLTGWVDEAFHTAAKNTITLDPLAQLDPARFFSNPDLWLGLAVAAALIAAAVRLRRYRGPI